MKQNYLVDEECTRDGVLILHTQGHRGRDELNFTIGNADVTYRRDCGIIGVFNLNSKNFACKNSFSLDTSPVNRRTEKL